VNQSEWRARRLEERIARRDDLIARFVGRFDAVGLPRGPTQVIPVDESPHRFVVCVSVRTIQEGALTGGSSERVVFAIHSPSTFFFMNGLDPEKGKGYPSGLHCFSLWRRASSDRLELDVAPWEPRAG